MIAGLIGLTLMWWQSRGGSEPPGISDSGPVAVDGLDGTPTVTEPERPAAADPTEDLPPLPDAESDLGLVEGPGEATEPATGEVDADPSRLVTDPPEPALPAEETATAEADEPDVEAVEETPTPDPGLLELTFNEQSWTEIFDANNQRVFVGLQEPGTTASVEGEPPFRLTIGNATGVELVWQGESVDLVDRAGANNVARFTLGD